MHLKFMKPFTPCGISARPLYAFVLGRAIVHSPTYQHSPDTPPREMRHVIQLRFHSGNENQLQGQVACSCFLTELLDFPLSPLNLSFLTNTVM